MVSKFLRIFFFIGKSILSVLCSSAPIGLSTYTMSFPGLGAPAGAGGMSEQEQKYVKMVCDPSIPFSVGKYH